MGRAPFSETEALNVRYLFETNPQIGYYVDLHSFGELILYSGGDDANQTTIPAPDFCNPAYTSGRDQSDATADREPSNPPDQVSALAQQMRAALQRVRGRAYQVQQAGVLYPTSGTADNYAFSRHLSDPAGKVYAYTIEFGTEFVPPYHEMQQIIAEIAAALTALCLAAQDGVFRREGRA